MTKPIRLIPRLDIKGPNLVKGVNLEGLRVLGKPLEFVNYYYNSGADEIIILVGITRSAHRSMDDSSN